MHTSTSIFGTTPQGDPIQRCTLVSHTGFSFSVLSLGARLCSIRAPDPHGNLADVLLAFDNLHQYIEDSSYFGAMIGRYANRIPDSRFSLNGHEYRLSRNKEHWTLHGGIRGFDKVLWSSTPCIRNNEICFTYQSPHLDQGFPGTLQVSLTFRLEPPSTLRIDYEATTDRPTVLNFTHHPYFNLAGAGNGTILDHVLTLFSCHYLELHGYLPTGSIAPAAAALDFTRPKAIGQDLGRGLATVDGGYDHTYVLHDGPAPATDGIRKAAHILAPASRRALSVFTNQPGLQFYTANQLDGSQHGIGGTYPKFASFTFEPEHFPDSVHHPNFPSTQLNPGEHYHTTSIFEFSTE